MKRIKWALELYLRRLQTSFSILQNKQDIVGVPFCQSCVISWSNDWIETQSLVVQFHLVTRNEINLKRRNQNYATGWIQHLLSTEKRLFCEGNFLGVLFNSDSPDKKRKCTPYLGHSVFFLDTAELGCKYRIDYNLLEAKESVNQGFMSLPWVEAIYV